MARPPVRPVQLRGTFFRGSDALRAGLLTPDQLRGSAWRRLFRDVYMDSRVPDSHRVRCRAVTLILPPGSAVAGRSAACLDDLPMGSVEDPVHILTRPGTRWARHGCRVVRTSWLPDGHVRQGDPPRTVAQRTAWEIASEGDLVEAVAALDVLFRAERPRKAGMDSWVAAMPGSPAARAIALADPRAESPPESRTRVRLTLAGFPPPVPQYPLYRGGRFVARLDLAWPEARVAVEYDGLWHGQPGQLMKDRARLNRIHRAEWEVCFLTHAHLVDDGLFASFCGQLRQALAAGRAH